MASRLQDVILRGTFGARPAANTVPPGTLYFSTDTLTTDRSDGTNWQTYADNGSSGSVLQFGIITLTDAQILLLNGTPIDIVVAPGAGFALIPHRITRSSSFAAGVYTNPSVRIRYAGDTTDLFTASTGVLNNATKMVENLDALDITLGTAIMDNKSIQISTSANPVGGNAANQYRVVLAYYKLTVL